MPSNPWNDRKRRKGGAILELAITGPLLLLMLFGATDLGRVFYHAVTLANAAEAGAFLGQENNISSGLYPQMQQAAQNDAGDLGTIKTTAERYCDCPDAPGVSVNCIVGTCLGYGPPRLYVKVQAVETFQPLVAYPGIPSRVRVGRWVHMRVQ